MWDPPISGIKLISPALAGGFFTTEPPGKPDTFIINNIISFILSKKSIHWLFHYYKNPLTSFTNETDMIPSLTFQLVTQDPIPLSGISLFMAMSSSWIIKCHAVDVVEGVNPTLTSKLGERSQSRLLFFSLPRGVTLENWRRSGGAGPRTV